MDFAKLYNTCSSICRSLRPALKAAKDGSLTQKQANLLAAHGALWMALIEDAMGVEDSE